MLVLVRLGTARSDWSTVYPTGFQACLARAQLKEPIYRCRRRDQSDLISPPAPGNPASSARHENSAGQRQPWPGCGQPASRAAPQAWRHGTGRPCEAGHSRDRWRRTSHTRNVHTQFPKRIDELPPPDWQVCQGWHHELLRLLRLLSPSGRPRPRGQRGRGNGFFVFLVF